MIVIKMFYSKKTNYGLIYTQVYEFIHMHTLSLAHIQARWGGVALGTLDKLQLKP